MTDPDSSEASAIAYKVQGNAAYQRGDYRHAIYLFSKGLELSPGPEVEHILYSNRSACYCLLEDYPRALTDADRVIQMKPNWPKGYTRRGAALQNLKRFEEAATAYTRALELEPGSDVAKKGLEDVSIATSQQSKRFVAELTPKTQASLDLAKKQLEQLRDVRWHFEILKDRIWLADPPLTPFRPRSLFIVDVDRKQLLSMTAHPSRDSLTLDQLVEFVVNTFLNSGIYPGTIEFSDFTLMSVLEPTFAHFNIQFNCDRLSEEKQRFFEEKIEEFETKEREQWQSNSKFAGVLKQRLQKGMMTIPGVTTDFLKHLLSAAAHFYRSKVYLYFGKPIGIRTADGETKVAIVTRNSAGQYSLAMSTVEASQSPADCGVQSYIFADPSTIPFDDADLIERYGWDIAEDKFPLPALHQPEGEDLGHPSLKDLEWYELAFWVLNVFIGETFAKPTYAAPPTLCCKCTVHTSLGPQEVLVTVPPTEDPGSPDMELTAPMPPAPKERLSHARLPPSQKTGSPKAPRAASEVRPAAAPKARAAASPDPPAAAAAPARTASPPPKAGLASAGERRPPPPKNHAAKAAVPEAAPSTKPPAHAPASPEPTPAARTLSPAPEDPGVRHGVQLSYRAEVEAYTGLLAPQEDVISLRRRMAEQDQTIRHLTTQLEDSREQVAMKQQLAESQKAHIDQLQQRVVELEKLNDKLRHDLLQASKKDQAYGKELLLAFANQSQGLVKALSLVDVDPQAAKATLEELKRAQAPSPAARAAAPSPEPPPAPAPKVAKPSPAPLTQPSPRPSLPRSVGGPETTPTKARLAAVAADRNTPPSQLRKKAPSISSKSSVLGDDQRRRPIPSGDFLAGPWVGKLKAAPVLPQNLTQAEYLAGPSCVF